MTFVKNGQLRNIRYRKLYNICILYIIINKWNKIRQLLYRKIMRQLYENKMQGTQTYTNLDDSPNNIYNEESSRFVCKAQVSARSDPKSVARDCRPPDCRAVYVRHK